MRILWLTSYAPWPHDFGGARRTYHLIEQAAQAGHAVHLLAFGDSDPRRRAEAEAVLGRLWAAGAGSGGAVRRLYNQVESAKFRRDEPRLWRRFTALFTTSEPDRRLVLAHWPGAAVTVVPNGVDPDFFHPAPPDRVETAPPTI